MVTRKSLGAIAEFQREILNAIGDVFPNVRDRISKGSRKAELYEGLFQSFDRQLGSLKEVLPFHEWVERAGIVLDGRPFTFDRHEYSKVPYHDDHPYKNYGYYIFSLIGRM